jgi:hypothetical protein
VATIGGNIRGCVFQREKKPEKGAMASNQRELAVRTLLGLARQLTVHTADFLRALAVARNAVHETPLETRATHRQPRRCERIGECRIQTVTTRFRSVEIEPRISRMTRIKGATSLAFPYPRSKQF